MLLPIVLMHGYIIEFSVKLFDMSLQVLKNPVVFMVIVGIISHFALGQRIPAVLSEFIDGLANSFGGAALFYLGLTMVSLIHLFILVKYKLFYFSLSPAVCFCGRLASLEN